MNIKVSGNIITIVSTKLSYEDLENLGPIYIKDAAGKKVYGVATSEVPSISEAGISFTHANSSGKAALNLITDCYDPMELKESFITCKSEALEAFMRQEDAIEESLNERKERFNILSNLVEVD